MSQSRNMSRYVRVLSALTQRKQVFQKSLQVAAYSVTCRADRRSLFNTDLLSQNRIQYSTKPNTWEDKDFKDIVDHNKLVVFMKGTPDAPQCGFSRYVIQILYMHGCEDYKTFNVLDDDVLRSRIKEFSEWPTIPQVYINGEFVGGFDILLQMHQSGDLIEKLSEIGHRSVLLDADKTEK